MFKNGNSRHFNKPIAAMSDSLNGKLITKHWCPSSKEIFHAIDTISKPIPVHYRVGKFDDHEDEIIIQDVVQMVLLPSTSNMGWSVVKETFNMETKPPWLKCIIITPIQKGRERIHLAWVAIVVWLTSVIMSEYKHQLLCVCERVEIPSCTKLPY